MNLGTNHATGFTGGVYTGSIENVTGGDGADTLTGSSGDNTIHGGGGADTINGMGGTDQLFGDAGDDTFTYSLVNGGQATVDGGADTDTQTVIGTGATETWNINPTGSGDLGIYVHGGASDPATDANAQVLTTGVEEIVINTNGGGDSVIISGDLGGTGVSTSTVTVNGDAGDNVLDASGVVAGVRPAVRVVLNGAGGSDTLKGGAGDDTLSGGDGSDRLTGGAGNDTLYGNSAGHPADSGDTAVYANGPSGYTVTFNTDGSVIVHDTNSGDSGGDEGTDTLWGVQNVNLGGTVIDLTANVLVYQGSYSGTGAGVLKASYATIQDAIDAGTTLDNDTIVLRPTTFSDPVNVTKTLAILGANHGVAGDDTLNRGAESIITGGVTLTAADVTLDGVKVTGAPIDDFYSVAVLVVGADDTIKNSVIDGTAINPLTIPYQSVGVGTFPSESNAHITHNLITGYDNGVYAVGSGTGTVDHNLFDGNGVGVWTEEGALSISANNFQNQSDNDISTAPTTTPFDFSSHVAVDNVFDTPPPADAQQVAIYAADSSGAQEVSGTAFGDFMDGEYRSGPFTFHGLGGNDLLVGNSLGDTLDGGAGDDALQGLDGVDTLTGGGNNDTLDGGTGYIVVGNDNQGDVATYAGSRSQYSIVQNPNGSYTITDSVGGRDGTDTLTHVEGVRFAGTPGITFELDANSPSYAGAFTRFDQTFDADKAGFFDVTNGGVGTLALEASGTGGIVTKSGTGNYALFNDTGDSGPYSYFDGDRAQLNGGLIASADIYLAPGAMAAGEGFDVDVSADKQNGDFLRDFVFHVTQDADTGKLLVAADNNSYAPVIRTDTETLNHAEITSSGWYTFQWKFYEGEDHALEVAMDVYDSSGHWVFSEVRNAIGDQLSTVAGGSNYFWFPIIDVAGGVAVDNVSLKSIDDNPVQLVLGTGSQPVSVNADSILILDTYATINDAIAAATSGNIVDLAAKDYSSENPVDTVDNLTFRGPAGALGVDIQMATGVTTLTLDGNAPIDVTGSSDANTIIGNAAANALDGADGNDTLSGLGGADTIHGNDGSDVIIGGQGDDTLFGDGGNDTFQYTAGDGHDTVDGGADTDTVDVTGTSSSDTVAISATGGTDINVDVNGGQALTISNTEAIVYHTHGGGDHITVSGDFGNTGLQSITVNNIPPPGGNDDTLDATGLTSATPITFNASGGNDTFKFADVNANDTFNAVGDGGDTADYSAVTVGETVNLSTGVATGTGTDTMIGVENVIGTNQDDTLTGSADSNNLDGGAGNDTLTGNAGADTLIGGAGTNTVNYGAETGVGAVTVNLSGTTYVAASLAANHATDTYGTTDALTNIQNVTAGSGYGDTVVLDGAFSDWTVTFDTDHWTATKGGETHVLNGVEKLVFQGSSGAVHLVDPSDAASAYTSVQDAVNHAASGDTILLSSGTFAGAIDIGGGNGTGGAKDITILGANHGQDSSLWAPGTESIIDRIGSSGGDLTLNGVEVVATVMGAGFVSGYQREAIGFIGDANDDLTVKDSIVTVHGSHYGDVNGDVPFGVPGAGLEDYGFGFNIGYNTGDITIDHVQVTPFTGLVPVGLGDFTSGYGAWINGTTNTARDITITNSSFDTGLQRSQSIAFDGQVGGSQIDISHDTFGSIGTHGLGAVRVEDFANTFNTPFDYLGIDQNTFVDAPDGGSGGLPYYGLIRNGSGEVVNIGTSIYNDGSGPTYDKVISAYSTTSGQTLNGGANADIIIGSNASGSGDTINAGGGNDHINALAGDDTITGGAGNDTINGGAGIDAATGYDSSFSLAVQSGHWVVTNGSETDTLTGVEKVVINGHATWLVDQLGTDIGGMQTIQSAVTNATAGDTILVAPDSYTGNVTIDKDVTLVSLDGAASTNITGGATSAQGVITITDSGDGATVGGLSEGFHITTTSQQAGIYLAQGASNIDVVGNTIDAGAHQNAIVTEGGVSNVTIDHNDVSAGSGGQEVYVNGTASTSVASTNVDITHNTFSGNVDGGELLGVESDNGSVYANTFNGSSTYAALDLWGANNDVTGPLGEKNDFTGFTGPVDIRSAQDNVDLNDATGADTATANDLSPTSHDVNLTGTSGANTLTGNSADNVLDGGAGNDALQGLGGDDTLIGGAGNDTLDGGDNNTVDAVAGTGGDTADYSSSAVGLNITLASGGATGVADGLGGSDTLTGIENITGGSAVDNLTGDSNANILIGDGGADNLTGGIGNDRLVGGAGADNMSGGTGSDVFVYEHRSDAGTAVDGQQDLISGFSVSENDNFQFGPDFFHGVSLPGDFNVGGHVNASYFVNFNVTGTTYSGGTGHPTFVLDDVSAGFAGTLWFDAEGNNDLSGPNDVKIADLSNSSVLTGFNQDHLLLI